MIMGGGSVEKGFGTKLIPYGTPECARGVCLNVDVGELLAMFLID